MKFTRFPQENVDPTYLKNIEKATNYFLSWFNNPTIPYKFMLINMHRIISKGYNGYTNCTKSPDSIKSLFRNHPNVDEIERPNLKKEWYIIQTNEPILKPRIKGISERMTHSLINKNDTYQLILPDPKYLDSYLNKLSEYMDKLMKSKDLRLLANYMYLFVITHPFEKINFSLCMAQVNSILSQWNFVPIYHEYLDFQCFVYDSDKIEEEFLKKVRDIIS